MTVKIIEKYPSVAAITLPDGSAFKFADKYYVVNMVRNVFAFSLCGKDFIGQESADGIYVTPVDLEVHVTCGGSAE